MESNPYKPPQYAYDAPETPSEITIEFISWRLKAIGLCTFCYLGLMYFGGMTVTAVESYRILAFQSILLVVVSIFGAILVGGLMLRISSPTQAIVFGVCTLVPLVGLFFLFLSLQKANDYLKKNGLKFELSSLKIKPLVEPPKEDEPFQPPNETRGGDFSNAAMPLHSVGMENAISLDAERLAQRGLARAYQKLIPTLSQFVTAPTRIREQIDGYDSSYSVQAGDATYQIDGPDIRESGVESWRLATFAIFDIVNRQLVDSEMTFYALGGGSGLAGVFLTTTEFAAATGRSNEQDRPYLPVDFSGA